MRDKGKRALRRPLSPLLLSPRSLGALYRRDLVLSYKSVAVAIASVAGRLHFRPQPVLRGDQEPPPHSHCYRCVRAHSSRIIRCGYVGLTLCGAGPFYSLDSTRGDGINRSLSRSLRHRLIQTHLRETHGEWGRLEGTFLCSRQACRKSLKLATTG